MYVYTRVFVHIAKPCTLHWAVVLTSPDRQQLPLSAEVGNHASIQHYALATDPAAVQRRLHNCVRKYTSGLYDILDRGSAMLNHRPNCDLSAAIYGGTSGRWQPDVHMRDLRNLLLKHAVQDQISMAMHVNN